MKKTIEIPNFVVNAKQFPRDEMSVYIRKKTILFVVSIDGCGNEFEIDKEVINDKERYTTKKSK